MNVKQLIEGLIDGGKLPADLIRDWMTGVPTKPGHDQQPLHEDTGGDVMLPNTPDDPMQVHPQEEPMYIEPNVLTFTVESVEQQVNFNEMVNALDSAQVKYSLNNTHDNDWELIWYQDQNLAVESVLEGLGIEFEADDTPEAMMQYYGHGAKNMTEAECAIEAVLMGADSNEVVNVVAEGGSKKYSPTGWIKKSLQRGSKEFKTTKKYPTEPEAKRAIVAGLLKKLGMASRSGGQ